VHLQFSTVYQAPKFFLRPGGARATPGYVYVKTRRQNNIQSNKTIYETNITVLRFFFRVWMEVNVNILAKFCTINKSNTD